MSKGRAPAKGLEPRVCPTCGAVFQPYRNNQSACSRRCRDATPDQREITRARDRRPERRSRQNELRRGKPITAAANRRNHLVRYGITPEQYDEMHVRQKGVCAICGSPSTGGIRAASRLHVDHDHVTKQVRELLCLSCNNGLGRFRDNPALLRAAAEYIERHRRE